MPGKTALRTDFVKIGTSGKTVDGRDIPDNAITEMAANYDPNEYTAVINYEHYSWAGNFGSVLELKAEKNKNGEMCLFAVLAPNQHMLALNAEGQKVFTSMEVIPNFSDTGQSYLGGLALTDSPASRGTTQLNFSHRVDKDHLLSDPQEFNLNLQEDEEQTIVGMFKQFLSTFKPAAPAASNPQEDDDMTKEQLEALTASLSANIDSKFAAFEQKFKPQTSGDDENADSVDGDAESATFSKEDATKLNESITSLKADFTDLKGKFEQLETKPTGSNTPNVTGDEQEQVL
jgi:hypothetical protein